MFTAQRLGIPVSMLRFTVLYGPGDTIARAIPNFIKQALAGKTLEVYGGEELRDYLHVSDAIHAVYLAATKSVSGVFNIGTGKGVTIKDTAETIAKLINPNGTVQILPREKKAADIVLDVNRAEKELGFQADHVFPDLLDDQITWHKEHEDFFMDGTLLDVAPRHYLVYAETVDELGGTPLDKPTYWNLKRTKTTWEAVLPKSGLEATQKALFLDKFIKKIENPEYLARDVLFDGAETVLAQLSRDHECYLVSLRRNEINLKEEVDSLGISPFFTEILSGHSENDGYDVKIKLIRDTLGDSQGIIIGDTEADIVTGQQLGLADHRCHMRHS